MAKFSLKQNLRASNDVSTSASRLTLRASIYPVCLVTILFFLWGFSYGLLDTLNKHFQNILHIDRARSAGLQAAYFGAYPFASLGHANWIMRHFGYKAVFIWGLVLYGAGSLLAWPALLYESFGGFCAAIFVIGNGLGSLETAANPYITICGPPKYSEMRINLSQAFNGIGSVVAPLMGSYIFFKDVPDGQDASRSLQNVQWVYLAIACFVFLLAGVFYVSNIPEITDTDMQDQTDLTEPGKAEQPLRKQYRLFHAAFTQFCYCGSQVAIASFFINYCVETRPGTSSSLGAKFLAGAQGAFAVGRFAGVILMRFFRPRKVFLAFFILVTIFTAASVGARGNAGVSMLFVVLFFESVIFPTIVALGMKGLGKHTKRGSGFIIGGVIGGAVVPPALGAAADSSNTGIAMAVPLAFFVVALTYPICCNFVPSYRVPIDAFAAHKAEETEARRLSVEEIAAKSMVTEHEKGRVGEVEV